jgi:tRNA A-37 threonylcarbamoyl transferase component Bud32
MIDALADIMARLHNAGISHGDAHLANFIVERREQPQLVLIDLDALRARKVSASVAANDLKRLLDYAPGSQAEHLRFLVRYARRRQGRIDTRELLRHCRHGRRGPGPLRDAA